MVELHHARQKAASAVETWHLTDAIEQIHLTFASQVPAFTFPLKPRGPCEMLRPLEGRTPDRAIEKGGVRSQAVAIRANDIAFVDLCQKSRATRRAGALHDVERLGRRQPMIEVHRLWREGQLAVGARKSLQIAQQCCVINCALLDARSLAVPVLAVVPDVIRMLIACSSRHAA
jgi:hypothetical protein